jgi:serine/threonine-protein kinase
MTPGIVVGGKYRLVRLLGQGAMGEVWAAVNEATGGEAALKLLSRPREELRHRLLREARACGKLRHRNIIDVHDVGETDEGEPFLVMALLNGETLADLLDRKRRLEPPRAAQIARDIARALAAAHKVGVVHRDLKPANVFLHREEGGDDIIVKVLDFGVSKDLEQSDGLMTVAGATVGSPAYMSPEQARSAQDLDHRTDLWSLGVVLFEMLTGKRPFEGDAHQVLAKIAFGPIPHVAQYVRNVEPELAALVARCLEREREKRFDAAEDLATALERFARTDAPAPASSGPRAPPEDDDGAMPTMRWNREVLLADMRSATVTPPGASAEGLIDAGALTLPDSTEILSAPPPARTLPLGTYAQGIPRAPRFGAPPPHAGAAVATTPSSRDLAGAATQSHVEISVLSSMTPVVQRPPAEISPWRLRAALFAVGGAALLALIVLVARALHAPSPEPPAPAGTPPAIAPRPLEEAIPPSEEPCPPKTDAPAVTEPVPSAAPVSPEPARKTQPSKKNEPARPNSLVLPDLQKKVKAHPRGI